MRLKFIYDHIMEWGLVVLIVGIVLCLFGFWGVLFPDNAPGAMSDALEAIGNWIYWFVLVGPIMVFVGAWYFFDTMRKKKEFEEMMRKAQISKAKFKRNLDDLEYLAWKLGEDYQRRVMEKKRDYKIK